MNYLQRKTNFSLISHMPMLKLTIMATIMPFHDSDIN